MKRTRPAARNGGWKRGPSRTSSALQTRALAPRHGRVTVLRASGGHREGDLREATACHTELGRGDQQWPAAPRRAGGCVTSCDGSP